MTDQATASAVATTTTTEDLTHEHRQAAHARLDKLDAYHQTDDRFHTVDVRLYIRLLEEKLAEYGYTVTPPVTAELVDDQGQPVAVPAGDLETSLNNPTDLAEAQVGPDGEAVVKTTRKANKGN